MSTLTKEWLQLRIAELEEERDATPGVVNEDAVMALAAMKLALASLEAEPVGEVVLGEYDDCGCHPDAKVVCIAADGQADWENFKDGTRLYTAPPAPVSVPDELTREEYKRRFMEEDNFDDTFRGGWKAHRAAMLQGADGNSPAHSGCRPAQNCISPAQCGNSPAIPDGWVMVPEEPTHEMLEAGDEQFGTYDVYRRMIAASPQQK